MLPATLLIVDNDGIQTKKLQETVAQLGYESLGPVATCKDAIALLNSTSADLILLDIDLNGELRGIETAEYIGRFSDVPIVFLTHFANEQLLEQAQLVSPYGYLVKPVARRELAATISMSLHRSMLDRKLRESQDALQKSEAKFRHLFEHSPLGIFRTSIDGRALAVNAEMARIIGCASPEEAIRDFTDLSSRLYVDPARRKQFIALLQKNGEVSNFEYQGKKKNGQIIWISMSARLTRSDSDNGDAGEQVIDGFAMDITEVKQTELKLLESEARNRLLSDVTMEGILLHKSGVAKDMNSSLARMFDYRRDELLNQNFMDFVHQDDKATVQKNMAKKYASPYTVRMMRKNGQYFFAEIEARDFQNQNEFWRVSAVRDVTERKQAEEERKKLQIQLTQAQKMESIGRLAGGVAHDFNNMLGVILGYSEIALEQIAENAPIRPALLGIQQAGQRSADLTKQLLAFARKQAVVPKVLDLNKTVKGMHTMLQRLIGEDIDLVWLPGTNLDSIKMDPSQIDQILANLCVNAKDAISGPGRITLETGNVILDDMYQAEHVDAIPGDYVLLTVSDTGCGMDQEILGKIFEPFFTTKDIGKGTGLGLATVFGILKQNNGFIDVYSEPDQGTTIKIFLPRYAANSDRLTKQSTLQPKAGIETILLVEDEPMILEMTTIMLEHQGYDILPAATPGEAIHLARAHTGPIHLLVTDVVMPDMNGRDLATDLISLHPNIKCLFMSGYTADVIAHHGVLNEGIHFIQKPFSRKELITRVRELLDDRERIDGQDGY